MSQMKSIEDEAKAFSKFDAATDVGTDLGSYRQGLFEGFLAGYQAAKDELADVGKVMDTCEHILDMEKMVDVNSPEKPDGWISVKERLPEDWEFCLWYASSQGEFDCGWENNECINLRCKTGCGQKFDVGAIFICEFHRKDKHYEQHYLIDDANNVALIDRFSHWMPLPKPPED